MTRYYSFNNFTWIRYNYSQPKGKGMFERTVYKRNFKERGSKLFGKKERN